MLNLNGTCYFYLLLMLFRQVDIPSRIEVSTLFAWLSVTSSKFPVDLYVRSGRKRNNIFIPKRAVKFRTKILYGRKLEVGDSDRRLHGYLHVWLFTQKAEFGPALV